MASFSSPRYDDLVDKLEKIHIVDPNTGNILPYGPKKLYEVINELKSKIDQLGILSAKAQYLNNILTSFDKLDQDTQLFIILDPNQSPMHKNTIRPEAFGGFARISKRRLFLLAPNLSSGKEKSSGLPYIQMNPKCLCDFYVKEKLQRNGLGVCLIQAALRFYTEKEKRSVQIHELAFELPSEALTTFLSTKFFLTEPTMHPNSFVVYPNFFESNSNNKVQNTKTKPQPKSKYLVPDKYIRTTRKCKTENFVASNHRITKNCQSDSFYNIFGIVKAN
ncbi:MAG: Alpha-tubulin N-acetyltransferase 1 [Paramarteilia canceri]